MLPKLSLRSSGWIFLLSVFLVSISPTIVSFDNWSRITSKEGKCSISFPRYPDYIKQTLPIDSENGNKLHYYVYVADNNNNEIFMVLVAKYPGVVDESNAVKNLEHFLSTLISQNSKNKLKSANLVKIQGHPGMDFTIETDKVYFKGRAVQANNSLYLLAVECDKSKYKEDNLQYFLESFKLHD